MSCTNCGSAFHEKWACPKPPKESTAALKEVHGKVRMTPASSPQPEPQDRIGGLGNDPQAVRLATGTQVPSVDTKSDRHKPGYMKSYMQRWRLKQSKTDG